MHVVPKGWPASNEVAWLYGAGRSEHAYGANLKWTGDDELVVEFLDARGQRLERASVRVEGRAVRVSLRSGINDPAAPARGMLANVEP